jgi:cell division protein FtsB
MVRSQQHLRAVQKELGRTNEQVVKLEKVIANLKTELDAVNKARAWQLAIERARELGWMAVTTG